MLTLFAMAGMAEGAFLSFLWTQQALTVLGLVLAALAIWRGWLWLWCLALLPLFAPLDIFGTVLVVPPPLPGDDPDSLALFQDYRQAAWLWLLAMLLTALSFPWLWQRASMRNCRRRERRQTKAVAEAAA